MVQPPSAANRSAQRLPFLDVVLLVVLVLIHLSVLYRPGANLWCHDVTHVDLGHEIRLP